MESFIEDQTIQLLFSIFAILMFIFKIVPYFSTKNILPNHYYIFGATLMLSGARYPIQIQYFSWQTLNIIRSSNFFLRTFKAMEKTQFTIKTYLYTTVKSHFNLHSEIMLTCVGILSRCV